MGWPLSLWCAGLGALSAHTLLGLAELSGPGAAAHAMGVGFGAALGFVAAHLVRARSGGAWLGLLLGGMAWTAGSATHWAARVELLRGTPRVCPGDCVAAEPVDSVLVGVFGLLPALLVLVVCALAARSAPSRDVREATAAPLAAATAILAALCAANEPAVAVRLVAAGAAVLALVVMARIRQRDRALRRWLESVHEGAGSYCVETKTEADDELPNAVDGVAPTAVIVALAAHGAYRASSRIAIACTSDTAPASVSPLRSRARWLLAAQLATVVTLAAGAYVSELEEPPSHCERSCPR